MAAISNAQDPLDQQFLFIYLWHVIAYCVSNSFRIQDDMKAIESKE